MAWGDSTALKFNVSEISKMRGKIQSTSTELAEFKTTLLSEIAEVKEKWKTPAGKKFFEEVDTGWAKQVDQYIKIIDAVDELLAVAETSYSEVEEEVKTITF